MHYNADSILPLISCPTLIIGSSIDIMASLYQVKRIKNNKFMIFTIIRNVVTGKLFFNNQI
ncbi:MAG: hypothetical protein KAT05_01920 [Spirochaetes bacterium]|nr:hypothetical protein [Spirochaetota bacterium]